MSKLKKVEQEKEYFCENGAYHSYYCCDTCWNRHPKAKNFEDKSFDKEFRLLANEEAYEQAIKKAMIAGFTKRQAQYLNRGIRAKFQQIVIHKDETAT